MSGTQGTAPKRGFRLQEFAAHSTKVNCAYFGRKFSGVLVTGGEDRKINMWAVGKPHALLSLSGHQSAVESVMFDREEESVLAGAAGGTVKMWDLEQARVTRTFTGHRANCLCLDYHPFGQFFGSGSLDTNFKVWDVRQKVCVHTYKGHSRGVTQVKFSPDGKWVVSGDQEGLLRIWDLTAGKLLHEFKNHTNAITKVRFHPNEYFLASSSADRTVKFWDLDTFSNVETAGPEATAVRAIEFTPNGEAMFSATQDCLKVWTWEPVIMHDYVDMGWSKLTDVCLRDDKLMGVTLNQSFVGIWVADLSRVSPFDRGEISLSSAPETSVFMKENTAPNDQDRSSGRRKRDQPTTAATMAAEEEEPVVVSQQLIDSLRIGARVAEPEPAAVSKASVGTAMGDSFFHAGLLADARPSAEQARDRPDPPASVPPLSASPSGGETDALSPGSAPVGLDFDSFASRGPIPPAEDPSRERRDHANDRRVCQELLQKHEVMREILSGRLEKAKAVKECFKKQRCLRRTVDYLVRMNDPSVLVDLCLPLLRAREHLKLDAACEMVPALCGLLGENMDVSGRERWVCHALEALSRVNDLFAETIAAVCSARQASGIDLHFEEKREYCERAKSGMLGLRPRLSALKASADAKVAARSLELDGQLDVYL